MISIQNLCVHAGAFALRDISFAVPSGEYAVLMGRTGCGKTTILEAICGLRRIDGGRIVLMGQDVSRDRPRHRGIGYVPQDRALFSTMSVYDHLAFAPRLRGWPAGEIRERVEELSGLLDITHLLGRKPHGLSGGESQRVALGRALSVRPGILILDEPLVALDDQMRDEMYTLLRSVRQHSRVTTLHITHDRHEAAALATVVLRLEEGRVTRVDPRLSPSPGQPIDSVTQ